MTEQMHVLLAIDAGMMAEQQHDAVAKHRSVSRISLPEVLLTGLSLGPHTLSTESRNFGEVIRQSVFPVTIYVDPPPTKPNTVTENTSALNPGSPQGARFNQSNMPLVNPRRRMPS